MNDYRRLNKQSIEYKKTFPVGSRIVLTADLKDPYTTIPAGTRGTVKHVDDLSQIHTVWDTGSSIAIIPDEDKFRKLTDLELDVERTEYAKTHMQFYIGEECASGMEFKTKEEFLNALSESIDEAAERGQKWFTVTIERENDRFLTINEIAQYVAKDPKPVPRCNKCGSPVITSDTQGYKYQCLECDEDLYEFETHIGEPMTEEEFNKICEALGF